MSYTNPSDYQGLTGLIGQSFYQLRLAGFIRIFISVYTVTEDCEDFVRVAVVTDGLCWGV